MLARYGRRLVLATALLGITMPASGCGEILSDFAEARHISKAARAYVYDGDAKKTWEAARKVLADKGFTLEGALVLDEIVEAKGSEAADRRTRVDVRLSNAEGGHKLELYKIEETVVEDVSWDHHERERDAEREKGLASRMGSAGQQDGDTMVYSAPLYRVWSEARQELLDAGIEVPQTEAVKGAIETPWIETSEGRSRRVVTLRDEGQDKVAVTIEVERERKKVGKHWETASRQRDGRLELAVIERIAPSDAAEIQAEAREKSQRASRLGERVDEAVGEVVEEAVKQEQEN